MVDKNDVDNTFNLREVNEEIKKKHKKTTFKFSVEEVYDDDYKSTLRDNSTLSVYCWTEGNCSLKTANIPTGTHLVLSNEDRKRLIKQLQLFDKLKFTEIITLEGFELVCNNCLKRIQSGKKIFKDTSQSNYNLCEDCYRDLYE